MRPLPPAAPQHPPLGVRTGPGSQSPCRASDLQDGAAVSHWAGGRGSAVSSGQQLTCVVGDVGPYLVMAGDQRWLGLAEVLYKLGLGHGGQHGAGALPHAGVCEQLGRGAPIGVPHLVAQLRIEASITAEGRGGGGRASGEGGTPASRACIQPAATLGTRPRSQNGGGSNTSILGCLELEWAAHAQH